VPNNAGQRMNPTNDEGPTTGANRAGLLENGATKGLLTK
jgi:hypothetical protein